MMPTYTYSSLNGFDPNQLMEELTAALGFSPRLDSRPDHLEVYVIVEQDDLEPTIEAVVLAHDPAIVTPSEQVGLDRLADKADLQAQADAAIADINAELVEANADLAGWDAMITADKMLATKRMLTRQIAIEQRQRKIIKYVRWL
jgi:hypothetical protein